VSGKEKDGHYATLSHCWGDPNHRPLLTTDQTLACRQQGIEDEELPKTFRHAVEVCRAIGIEFLWIDSLCIIQEQESREDWAKEAPKMAFVYGDSRLNICAAAAEDSTQGCFKERHGLFFWPCPVVMFGQECYISHSQHGYGGSFDAVQKPKGSLLFQRAWVFQEQALSRRSITFTGNTITWCCRKIKATETRPLGSRYAGGGLNNQDILHYTINGLKLSTPNGSDSYIYDCWHKTIENFTSRNLTYEDDRLPAIAGVAKRLGMTTDDSYHAGLWRRDMLPSLLWYHRPSTPRNTTKSARAPSWSWASTNGEVTYDELVFDGPYRTRTTLSPLIDILDVSDPPTCENHPFGPTSKASLRLSGVLLKMEPGEHEQRFSLVLVKNSTPLESCVERTYWDVRDLDKTAQTHLHCLPICVRHGKGTNSERHKTSWEEDLKTGVDRFEMYNRIFCLILQPIEGEEGTYSRVGVCAINRQKKMEIAKMAFGEPRSLTLV
jgi:hypothetical protein